MAGRYRILEQLGEGGVGAVFKAYDTQLNRYVATKRLLTKEEADRQDERSETLVKEAGSLATLQHPNIVSVYDLANDEDGFFIVMELLEGDTLADWIKSTTMTLPDFYELATQTLEAILTAHHQSILHRDLKPENLKVIRLPGGRLQVKVLDFGLARLSYGARKMTEDQSGNIMGSIYYMAPEQFQRKPVDGRTDLYALGCMFYQVLSGRRPFDHATVQGIIDQHVKHIVHPLQNVASHVPRPVCDWVMWLMNLDPAHRPANAQQALDTLRELHSSGWFKTAENVAVAIPVANDGVTTVRRTTGQNVRPNPASGPQFISSASISQKLTTNAARGGGNATGMMKSRAIAAPVTAAGKKPARIKDDDEGSSLPGWIWPAAVVILGIIGWTVWSKVINKAPDAETKDTKAVVAAKNPDAYSGPLSRTDGFITAAHILSYRPAEKSEVFKTQSTAPKNGDKILKLLDLNPAAGTGDLIANDNAEKKCPTYIVEKVRGIVPELASLRFAAGNGMTHRMDPKNAAYQEYPFGNKVKDKGLTAIVVARPKVTNAEITVLQIADQDNKAHISIKVYPNNDIKLVVQVGGERKEGRIVGRNHRIYNIFSIVWDGASNKASLTVRGQDGGKARVEIDAPKAGKPVLNEIRLSAPSKNPLPNSAFEGDIAELVVMPYPMKQEDRSLLDWQLAQYYFSTPGSRY